jgi:hypothetical protein
VENDSWLPLILPDKKDSWLTPILPETHFA